MFYLLYFFQNNPKIIPTDAQKEDTPKIDTNLNSLTKFIGAVISSGFSGIIKNIIAINPTYPNNPKYFLLSWNFVDSL